MNTVHDLWLRRGAAWCASALAFFVRVFSERAFFERAFAMLAFFERAFAMRAYFERAFALRAYFERAFAMRAYFERAFAMRAYFERAFALRAFFERAFALRAFFERAFALRAFAVSVCVVPLLVVAGCGAPSVGATETSEVQGSGTEAALPTSGCELVLRELAACPLEGYIDDWVRSECGDGDASCANTLAEVVPGRVEAAKTYWQAFCDQVEHATARNTEEACEQAVESYLGCRRAIGCHDFFGEYFTSPDAACATARTNAREACSFM